MTTSLPAPASRPARPERYRALGDRIARLDRGGVERELEAVRAALRSWRDVMMPLFAARQRMRDDLDRLLERGVQLGVVTEAALAEQRLHDIRSQWFTLARRYGSDPALLALIARHLLEQKERSAKPVAPKGTGS